MELKLLDPAVEEGTYCWLIALGGSAVGVHGEAGWCVRLNDGSVVVLDAESKFVPLGPLLEMQANDFSAFVQSATAANPRFAHQINGFPRETLLKFIFHTSYSSYWPERALAWLETDQALWPRFQGELLTFSKNKVMSQRARQQAQKMMQAAKQKPEGQPGPGLASQHSQ